MDTLFYLAQILLLAFAVNCATMRDVWSDVIVEQRVILTPDGVESALCETDYEEFIKITCNTGKWECTVYPEVGISHCKLKEKE